MNHNIVSMLIITEKNMITLVTDILQSNSYDYCYDDISMIMITSTKVIVVKVLIMITEITVKTLMLFNL